MSCGNGLECVAFSLKANIAYIGEQPVANNPQHDQQQNQKPNPNQTTQKPGQGSAANPMHKPDDRRPNPGQGDPQHRQDQKRTEKR